MLSVLFLKRQTHRTIFPSVFGWEWKKLWQKQKWGFLFVCLLFLKVLSITAGGYTSSNIIDLYEQDYLSYFQQYGGRLTEEKADSIETAYQDILNANAARSQLEFELEQGNIGLEEYQTYYQSLYEKSQQSEIFPVFYTAYQYAAEDPSQHWLLDCRGWETMLCSSSWDWLLILGILLLTVLVVSTEFSARMDLLLRTTVQGSVPMIGQKWIVLAVSSVTLCLSYWVLELSYLCGSVGLPEGNAPLQSIPWFEDTSWALSLVQAAWVILGLRLFGCCYFASCLFWGALIVRRKDAFLASGLGFALFPILALSNGGQLYHLPLPHGFLQGTGFLWPNQYQSALGADGAEQIKIFTAVPPGKCALLLLLCLLVALLLWKGSLILWRRKCPFVLTVRKGTALFLLLALLFLLPSCKSGEDSSIIFNSEGRQTVFPCGAYSLSLSSNGLHLPDTYDNNLISRKLDNSELLQGACMYDGDCYYLINNVAFGSVSIYRISSENFTQELVYTDSRENDTDFFGLLPSAEKATGANLYIHFFFVTDSYYYLCSERTLTQIYRINGFSRVVLKDLGQNPVLCYVDGLLYYISMDGTLKIWSEKTDETKATNLFCRSLVYQDGRLTYTDLFHQEQIWGNK